MKQKTPILTLTIVATAVILAGQAVTAAGAVSTSAGDAIGFAVTDAAIGESFAVDVLGTSTAIAGASISKGARVQVGTGGKVITATSGISLGVALNAAAADTPVEIFIEKRPATA